MGEVIKVGMAKLQKLRIHSRHWGWVLVSD